MVVTRSECAPVQISALISYVALNKLSLTEPQSPVFASKAEAWRCYCRTPQVSANSPGQGCGTDVIQVLGEYFWDRPQATISILPLSSPRLETEAQRQSLQSHKLPSLQFQPHAPLVREQVFQTPGLGTCPSLPHVSLDSLSLSEARAPLEGQNQLLAVAFSWQNSKGFLP